MKKNIKNYAISAVLASLLFGCGDNSNQTQQISGISPLLMSSINAMKDDHIIDINLSSAKFDAIKQFTSDDPDLTQEEKQEYISLFNETKYNHTCNDANSSCKDLPYAIEIPLSNINKTAISKTSISVSDYYNLAKLPFWNSLSEREKQEVFKSIMEFGDETLAHVADFFQSLGLDDLSALIRTALMGNNIFSHTLVSTKMTYDLSDIDKKTLDTTLIDGKPYNLSAATIFPVKQNSVILAPIVVWNHGTTMEKDAVPSEVLKIVANNKYIMGLFVANEKMSSSLFEAAIAADLAAQGFIVVMPDYLGQGDDGKNRIHPYISYELEARAVTSAIDKAIKIHSDPNIVKWDGENIYIIGYSEGGYVTMSAAKYIQDQRPDLASKIKAIAPGSGPYDMSTVMRDTLMSSEPFPRPAYMQYVLFSYADIYPQYLKIKDSLKALTSGFISTLTSKITSGIEGATSINEYIASALGVTTSNVVVKNTMSDSFVQELVNPDSNISKLLKYNDVYNWKPNMKVYLSHCINDDLVSSKNTDSAYNFMTNNKTVDTNKYILNEPTCPKATFGGGGIHIGGFPTIARIAVKAIKAEAKTR